MRPLLRLLGIAAVVLMLVAGFGAVALSAPRPEGIPGPEADALAREVEGAVARSAWEQTLALTWVFAGRNEHLWDRSRGLDRVRWGRTEVLLDLTRVDGRAWVKGEEVLDEGRRRELMDRAFAAWINDSFWLNPLVKLFDEGVIRSKVRWEGEDALLITYSTGGLTPGDAYLWLLGEDRLPTAWRMWVSIIPIGGLKATWEEWVTLPTGAKVATRHAIGPITLRLTEVRGAATLAELAPGPDPFAPLFEGTSTP